MSLDGIAPFWAFQGLCRVKHRAFALLKMGGSNHKMVSQEEVYKKAKVGDIFVFSRGGVCGPPHCSLRSTELPTVGGRVVELPD